MSNRRNPQTTIPTPGVGEVYACRCAVIVDRHDPALVAGARRATHDAVIATEGPWRRSGIWWTEHIAKDGARRYQQIIATLTDYADSWTEENAAIQAELIGKLSEPRALLVVAWCISTERGKRGRP